MDAVECEFLAGDELIKIVPNFTEPELQMIGGEVGPFEAGIPVDVPIWMAVHLRKRHKCTIMPPKWLLVDELKTLIEAEGEVDSLTQLPPYIFEIAHVLVRDAKEDLEEGDQLKALIQDLWDKREAKLRTSMLKFLKQTSNSHARMDNVLQMEVASLRGPLLTATKQMDKLTTCKHVVQELQ